LSAQEAATRPAQRVYTDYVVGPQDVLTITSYDQADLSGKFTIEADGTFTYPLIGFLFGLKAFCVVILGGLGSVFGAMVASVILGLVESFVGTFFAQGSSWAEAVSFVILILVLLLRPRGIFGVE